LWAKREAGRVAGDNGEMTEQETEQRPPEPHLGRLQARVGRGQSLEEAAEALGMPLWSARATYRRSGLPLPKLVARKTPLPPEMEALGRRLHAHLKVVDSATPEDLAEQLDVTVEQVRGALWPVDEPRLLGPVKRKDRFPDEVILIALQTMSVDRARQLGKPGRAPVTAGYWDAHRDPAIHPAAATVKVRWGTWRGASSAAGIPVHGGRSNDVMQRRWTADECLAAASEFFRGGHGWASYDYDEWVKDKDLPSAGTVIGRLGKWTLVRDALLA
jgi:hypothetical protein